MIPHDLDAERQVLGACLIIPKAVADTMPIVTPADFYRPAHATLYAAMLDLYGRGDPVDPMAVAAEVKPSGVLDELGGPGSLLDLVNGCAATSSAAHYARVVVEHAARRSILSVAGEVSTLIGDGKPAADVLDHVRARLESVSLPTGRIPDDLLVLDDLLDRPVESRSPWVVPGLLRQDWRVIVVAPEGRGKSALLTQVAVCASQGVHPLTFQPVRPVRTLIVDLENPEERIIEGCTPIRDHTRMRAKDYDSDRAWLWHRPGGIDLRSRADAAALEAVLGKVRPQLVVMGPAYKASQRGKGEGWDESAMGVQRVLDSLRTRFGFALLMEDHAPQSTGGVRDLRPFGSSLWLRWPEVGLKLAPDSEPPAPRSLIVKRWRGDRLPNDWPARLEEGNGWPWVGVWDRAMPSYSREEAEAS